jgi:hypothetical protein
LELPEVTMGLTRRFLGSPRAATQYRAHA